MSHRCFEKKIWKHNFLSGVKPSWGNQDTSQNCIHPRWKKTLSFFLMRDSINLVIPLQIGNFPKQQEHISLCVKK